MYVFNNIKKDGNWWNVEVLSGKVMDMIISDNFQCYASLDQAFEKVLNFDRAIDVGTWIGDSTEYMCRQFAHVIGFEPNPVVYECCIKNLQEKSVENVVVYNKGLSDVTGHKLLFNKSTTFSGWINTVEGNVPEVYQQKSIAVESIRLDDYNFENIDFIKIDVDSHEGYVLDGARKFLENNSPVIMLENKLSIRDRQHINMPDPVTILNDLGYNCVAKVARHDYIFIKTDVHRTTNI
jgi:FkbM family methyltransferase